MTKNNKQQGISKLKELLEKIFDFHENQFKLATNGKIKCTNRLDAVLFSILAKSSKTIHSIKILTDNNQGEDSLALSKTVFENYINAAYMIKEDSENRTNLFVYFGLLDFYKKAKLYFGDKIPKPIADNFDNEFLNRYDKLVKDRKNLLKNKTIKIVNNSWSLVSIASIAKEVGEEKSYNTIYKLSCQQTHLDNVGLQKYININKTNVNINDLPNLLDVEESLVWSINSLLKLYKIIIDRFSIKLIKEIRNFEDNLSEILIKYHGI